LVFRLDHAVVGVAVVLRRHDGVVLDATIGITGATRRAYAADSASPHLNGKQLPSQNIASAALLTSEQAECLSDPTLRRIIASISSRPRSSGR
jgi:aerobic carbon-monoxide dehydrogenase medium subunit